MLKNKTIYTFDIKKNIVILQRLGVDLSKVEYDLMLSSYLLNYNNKDDIAYLMNPDGYEVSFYEDGVVKKNNSLEQIENILEN